MPSDLVAILEVPLLLAAIFLIGGVAGVALEKLRAEKRREIWRKKNRDRWKSARPGGTVTEGPWLRSEKKPDKQPDAADQLRIVMGADFTIQPILNKREARVFRELDVLVLDRNPNWQVMAQVSLGEILRSKDSKAYSCINSKRVDLLLMNEDCHPIHAIEYQGDGHYQGTAAARDAIKKEALRRAGIGYHEIVAGKTTPSDLKRLVERLVATPQENERPIDHDQT